MTTRFDIIATDIDGTLLTSRGEISPATRAALRAARDAGSVLMLASGRPEHGLRHLAEVHGIDLEGLVLSSNNGAAVVDAVSEEIITERTMDLRVVARAQEIAREYGMTAITPVGLVIHTTDADGYYVQYEPKANDMELQVTDDLTTLGDHIHKVLLTAEPEHMARHRDTIANLLDGQAEVGLSAPFYLEINAKGADKGTGLADFAAARGIDLARTIAFGDNENDIAMLSTAGTGVAMGNALPHVKEIADYVTTTNDEDGIARALAELA